ncbi:Zn-ribbon domain-containing OB-fold protein [Noviherbaspirillum sedimenti]|uniref:DNA-binding protein n=1 Tax=Noviherbaspirillum sedimenti TaxID=2320865 RepID=A0A3A3G333_9BURK|nr:OB-fold domain-containing protein [Noviherbaspirillum sedimenti]RJG02908.1 DNA-binding protein [Noviherbaspirillum sedimenti]
MTNATIFEGDGPEKVYHELLKQGKFRIQRCGACGGHIFFPRVICTLCGSADLAWIAPSGRGTVYSTTVLRRKPESGGNLNLVLVDLEEGPRMMSRVEGISAEEVKIGMAVEASIIEDKGAPLVVFHPAGEAK